MRKEMENKKHFVLVHGASHGAWCWYKLVSLLKLAGHQVTALDLGASGINPKQIDDIKSISDYVEPLMDFMTTLPEDERVILVGHSLGGFCISLAMEKFPEKVLAAVFVAAFMPNCSAPLATLVEEFFKWTPLDSLMDCTYTFGRGAENPPTSGSFGPIYLEKMIYQNCQPEDLQLAKMLVRPCGLFFEELIKGFLITEAKYGSINRVFVVCHQDGTMLEGFQRWMIENSPPKEVRVIKNADHMVMLSKPQELCQCLQEIAQKI